MNVRIPGKPVGKGRPRFARSGHAYTPERTRRWERMACDVLRACAVRFERTLPVRVCIVAVHPRPRRAPKGAPEGRYRRVGTPDVDNVAKAVLDALVLADVLDDDAQVVALHVEAWCAATGEAPHVDVVCEVERA